MIGKTIAHYRVVEKIGKGGMGEVYRASDTKLGRDVALKVLPAAFAQNPERMVRFLHEAKTLAALNHPNIAAIYGLEDSGGAPHLVLELVEGETLDAVLRRGPMALAQALATAIQIASAVEAAHESGIVHRDLKPANVMLTRSGAVKVLDFGLATDEARREAPLDSTRSPTVAEPAGVTVAGTIMGTLAYMSPEQARGLRVDRRSDVWSFGCILFECLVGRPTFAGDTASDLIAGILQREPEWEAVPPDTPARLRETLRRCLRKDAEERPRDIRDVRLQLEEIAAGGRPDRTSPHAVSLVVLPFENRSADADDEYFSDGLTEEVITDLANLEGIRVISRTSAMKLKGTRKDMPTLGRELDVQYVLSGSVRRAGTSLRVNAALVEAAADRQVWAERFTGSMDEVFDIQEKVARATADAVKVKLSGREDAQLKTHGIRDPRAYDLYLRARHATDQWTKLGLERARRYLDGALELEPGNPVLLAALGYNFYNFLNTGMGRDEMLADARRCVDEALRWDPDSTDARRLKGVIALSLEGDMRTALEQLRFVLDRTPEDTEAAFWCSLACAFVGRMPEARDLSHRMMALDPLNTTSHTTQAWILLLDGRFEEAAAITRATYRREPNMFATFSYAQALIHAQQWDEMDELVDGLRAEAETVPLFRLLLAQVHGRRGDRAGVEALIDAEFMKTVDRDFQYPWQLAIAWLFLGEKDKAISFLDAAVSRGFWSHRFLGELDPHLAALRDDPRFVALMARAKAEAAQI